MCPSRILGSTLSKTARKLRSTVAHARKNVNRKMWCNTISLPTRGDVVFLWPTIAPQRGTKTFESGLLSYRHFLPPGVYFNFEKVKLVLSPVRLILNRVNIKNEKKLVLLIYKGNENLVKRSTLSFLKKFWAPQKILRLRQLLTRFITMLWITNTPFKIIIYTYTYNLDYGAYWKVDADYLYLSILSNWKFTNLKCSFRNMMGCNVPQKHCTKRTLGVESNVATGTLVGNQMTRLAKTTLCTLDETLRTLKHPMYSNVSTIFWLNQSGSSWGKQWTRYQ